MPDVVSTRLELEDGIIRVEAEIGLINRYCVPRAYAYTFLRRSLRSMRTHSWVLARRVGPGGAGPRSPSLGP